MAFEYAIALTGGIASGKSTVANFFKQEGFSIIDADAISHQVLDAEYKEIEKLFGDKYVKDTKVQRKLLGALIFKDAHKRNALETLLHPLIYNEIKRLSDKEERHKKPYFIDIPLFFETNRYPIEKVLVVYAPVEIQLERLMHREGYSKNEALSRIQAQISIETKRLKAMYLIDNSDDLAALMHQCQVVKSKILGDFQ